MNNKRPFIYLPVFFALTLIIGMFIGIKLLPVIPGQTGFFSFDLNRYDKLNDVLNYIENDYVDSVNRQNLIEKSISGLLQSLDPHSQYIPAAEFNDANDPLVGNFDGIGVQFRIVRDTITVINTIKGGPSEKEGVAGGDRIVAIDGKNVAGIKISEKEVMKKLKGKRGTTVKVDVFRKGRKGLLAFTITRDVIPTRSVDIAYMVNGNTGYIKLSKFSGSTLEEITEAISNLRKAGMKKLIFDLRGNGGGYMDAAIGICDEFLGDKKLIVYTEGRHRPKKNYYATAGGLFEKEDLVILIDEFSASASEIVAGAVQDNDRGTIIGRRSFGKGLVQEQIQLVDGSAIRLTVARYHTPTGRCIQKSYQMGSEEYYNEFYQRLLEEEADVADSLNFADTIAFQTTGGKIVYGGGGIMPDIYIPYKLDIVSDYYRKVLNRGLIYQFAFDYADRNRRKLLSYSTARAFNAGFVIDEATLGSFVAYADKNGVRPDPDGLSQASGVLRAQLKGAIGRNIFDDEAFYPVILPSDPAFNKGLEILKAKK